jgi:hypothetical protein
MENFTQIINETSSGLSELKKPLELVSLDSESTFINLGKDLQSIYSDAESLAALTVETATLINGESDACGLSRIVDITKQSLKGLDVSRADVDEVLPRVKTCLEYMKDLYDKCPRIIKIAKTLRMVGLNLAVESSRQDGSDNGFDIFVKEIKSLARRINEIAHKMMEDANNSRVTEKNDFEKILNRKNQLRKVADEARAMVSSNLSRIEGLMDRSLQALQRSEVHSRNISNLIGDIVVSIQFHDITRQQIAHVIEAVQDIEALYREEAFNNNSMDGKGLMEKASAILLLQILQIKQVIVEISEAHNKIGRAFDDLGAEIDAFINEIIRLENEGIDGNKNESQIEMLVSGIDQLEMVLSQGKGLTNDINNVTKEASSSAGGISEYLDIMKEIGMDLHIKAINALIMSRQLGGKGVTLGALAKDVREISKESNEFVTEIVKIISSIDKSSTELMSNWSQNEQNFSSGNGASIIAHLHERFFENTTTAIRKSVALKDEISRVKSHLSFFDEMKYSLEGCLNSMDQITESIRPYISNKIIHTAELEKVSQRYTMHIERGIHRRTVGGSEDKQKLASDFSKHQDNDLGDNVELF